MKIPIVQIDSFTNQPFSGNPAGVCLLDSWLEDDLMQNVAMEMNLAETAFVVREGESHRIRWFTPKCEVDLCGHATLASALAIWDAGFAQEEPIVFESRSGQLTANQADGFIELNFPAKPVTELTPDVELLAALGLSNVEFVGTDGDDFLVLVQDESTVRSLSPNFGLLKSIQCRGCVVTGKGDNEYDFVSRFFAPQVGIDEDPVTGSAHCALAPFWASRLGKNELFAYQASERGGEIRLVVADSRVFLKGQAIFTLRGEFQL